MLSCQVTATQAEPQVIVFQVTNLVLESNESFTRNLVLEAYAQYSIISEINVTDETIIEPIVTISIQDMSLSGYTILHRGDRPYANVTWTPDATDYTIEIENNGEVDAVEVSVTITQTEPPDTWFISPGYRILSVLDTLLLMFALPAALVALALLLYKYRRTH